MAQNCAQLHTVLVLGDHGNRDCLHLIAQSTVQRRLAVLDLGRDLLLERPAFCHLPLHIDFAVRHVPGPVHVYDQSSRPVTVRWDVPHGLGHHCQHGRVRLRPSLGGLGRDPGLDVVVDRRHPLRGDMFLSTLRHHAQTRQQTPIHDGSLAPTHRLHYRGLSLRRHRG